MINVLVPSYLVVFGNTPILFVSPALSGNSCVSERLCAATFLLFLRSVSAEALVDDPGCAGREIRAKSSCVKQCQSNDKRRSEDSQRDKMLKYCQN